MVVFFANAMKIIFYKRKQFPAERKLLLISLSDDDPADGSFQVKLIFYFNSINACLHPGEVKSYFLVSLVGIIFSLSYDSAQRIVYPDHSWIAQVAGVQPDVKLA